MKAISIKEPWLSHIVLRGKTIEMRDYGTKHRGDILLCSSSSPESPSTVMAVAVAELVDVRPMTPFDEPAAKARWYRGAIAWVLNDVRILQKPFPVQGHMFLYDVDVREEDLRYAPGC